MKTNIFVERPENKGKMIIDFTLNSGNYHYAPNGIIRIARFENIFWPEINRGYYGDIYMKRFIRKWKRKTYENIQRINDRRNASEVLLHKGCEDVNNIIIEFL